MDALEAVSWKEKLYQPLKDTSLAKVDPKNSIVQFKMDGWWIALIGKGDMMYYITRGGEIRKTQKLHKPMWFALVGEWMYGTNWAQNYLPGWTIIHDCYSWGNDELYRMPYHRRYSLMSVVAQQLTIDPGYRVKLIENFSFNEKDILWRTNIEGRSIDKFEGLVFKNPDQMWGEPFYRAKAAVTMDYVCMNVIEGGGRLKGTAGSLVGGLYKNGKLTAVCSVGGGMTDQLRSYFWEFRDECIGRVFQAHGWELFSSGALRHPNFDRWREDKFAISCVWPPAEVNR